MVFDETGAVLSANNAVATTLGLSPDQNLTHAQQFGDLNLVDVNGSAVPVAAQPIAQAIAGAVGVDSVVGLELPDHSRRWVLVSTSGVAAPDGGRQIIATFSDVSGQLEHLSQTLEEASQLRHQALYDSLTGLPNRALLLDRMNKATDRARRRDTATALLVIDMDGFKAINDQLGHSAGDEVLVQVAFRLRSTLRDEDTAVRLGGDEFVILCEELDAKGADVAANSIADRIQRLLDEPYTTSAGPAATIASIGMSLAMPGTLVDLNLLQEADVTMLQNKRDRQIVRGDRVVATTAATGETSYPADARRTVFVVDDDAAMRLLATRIIDADPQMTVVGEAADGMAAIAQILEVEPDIVLCDVMMPGISGPEVVRTVRRSHPSQLFAFWSATTVDQLEKHRRSLGVPYVEKDRIDELPTRLQEVMAAVGPTAVDDADAEAWHDDSTGPANSSNSSGTHP